MIRRIRDWLSGRKATREFRRMAETVRHPYQDEIDAAPRGFFLNCTAQNCTLNGERIPDGPFGPQCDLPEGVQALAVDSQYVYADDGCRYRRKA